MSKEDIEGLPPATDANGVEIPGQRILTDDAMRRIFAAVIPLISQSPQGPIAPNVGYSIDNNAVGRSYYDRNFGILSLTESPTSLLMWAHYGDQHSGVAIGFDEHSPFFQGSEIVSGLQRLGKVDYSKKRPVISPSTQDTPKIFLRKSEEWEYEKEWRLIRPLEEAIEVHPRQDALPLHLFDVPHESIQAILVGALASDRNRQEISALCADNASLGHVKIHQMSLSKEEFALEATPALTEEEQTARSSGRALYAKPFDI